MRRYNKWSSLEIHIRVRVFLWESPKYMIGAKCDLILPLTDQWVPFSSFHILMLIWWQVSTTQYSEWHRYWERLSRNISSSMIISMSSCSARQRTHLNLVRRTPLLMVDSNGPSISDFMATIKSGIMPSAELSAIITTRPCQNTLTL